MQTSIACFTRDALVRLRLAFHANSRTTLKTGQLVFKADKAHQVMFSGRIKGRIVRY